MFDDAQHDGRGEIEPWGWYQGDYFDDGNDNKTDVDGNVLDEADKFVHMMEVKIHHSQHVDPTTQFQQDHMDFWTYTQMVIQD